MIAIEAVGVGTGVEVAGAAVGSAAVLPQAIKNAATRAMAISISKLRFKISSITSFQGTITQHNERAVKKTTSDLSRTRRFRVDSYARSEWLRTETPLLHHRVSV